MNADRGVRPGTGSNEGPAALHGARASFDRLVLVTRRTRLEDLVRRFNSRRQAKFYIEHAGGDFSDYQREDDAYRGALDEVRSGLDLGLKLHVVDREYMPNYLFSEKDVVLTLGQDGLVANTAKYVGGQPLVAVNPEPARFDGILLPFTAPEARAAVTGVLEGTAGVREVAMAQAALGDGQSLLAFNDLFIGHRSHVSARYRLSWNGRAEEQSSSGLIVSTGAGSTGWLSSLFNMADGISRFRGGSGVEGMRIGWEEGRLVFVVREPFASRHSQASLVCGILEEGDELAIESRMPLDGVIFSDGVERDALRFGSGATARIRVADRRARLVVGTER